MFDGTRANFPSWKQNFLCLAKLFGLFGILTEGVDVPVADETMSIAALQESFPHENIHAGTFNMPTLYQLWVWEREANIDWSMVICQGSTRSELP